MLIEKNTYEASGCGSGSSTTHKCHNQRDIRNSKSAPYCLSIVKNVRFHIVFFLLLFCLRLSFFYIYIWSHSNIRESIQMCDRTQKFAQSKCIQMLSQSIYSRIHWAMQHACCCFFFSKWESQKIRRIISCTVNCIKMLLVLLVIAFLCKAAVLRL